MLGIDDAAYISILLVTELELPPKIQGSIIKVGVRDRAYKKFQKSRAYLPKIR